MARQKFTDMNEAVKFLTRNGIQVTDRKITPKNGKNGLKCWSAIDYLKNYHRHFLAAPM